MRRWHLVLLLLLCLLLPFGLVACSGGQDSQSAASTTLAQPDATTTTAIPTTTTTLAPATWEAVTPTNDPPAARLGASVAYVAQDNKLLLFAGWTGGAEYLDDTWSYDLTANAWSKLKPQGPLPPARAAQAMAYDPVAKRLIVFGGYDGTTYYNDTWMYDLAGNTWTALSPTGLAPAARQGHSLIYDPVAKKMILFGGYGDTAQFNDTWAYDPARNAWTDLRPGGTLPAARDSQAMSYDSDNKVMILFGGWSVTTQFNDTWAYDPAQNSWAETTPSGKSPAARALSQMVYDPSIKRTVLFGGGTSSATFNDTWMFDYSERSWAPVATVGDPPSARAGHATVYVSSGTDMLLFGGSDGIGAYFNDLWRLRR
jgi:N-acetylneuraminic acid mutarotase